MTGRALSLAWKPPGPVAAAFMACNLPVQILNGPVGSGKTTACAMKVVRLAARQQRSTRDGLRKVRATWVRDTYRQLWKTTLPSWWKRVPRGAGEFSGAENAPACHHVRFRLADESIVDLQADFLAIGENAVEDVLRGYEPTFLILNEIDLLAREVLMYAVGRAGRYPDMSEGGPTWHGVLGDCNAPPLHSWLYQDVFRATPEHIGLFRQPSGFDATAENVENLPPDYYKRAAAGQPDWYVKRMLENVPGYSRAGKPVYPEFNDGLHVARDPIEPLPACLLEIGLDAGGSPAAVFAQRLFDGSWRVLDELVTEQGTGPMRFADMLAQRLNERFPTCRLVRGWADPAAQYGADKQAGEEDWIQIVARKVAIDIRPAPSNARIPRWEAVRRPLTTLIDGKPAFTLSPRCMMLREGFNSGYSFRKIAGRETDAWHDEAHKNEYSHPHDALQYLLLGGGEYAEIHDRRGRAQAARMAPRRPEDHDWNPLG